MQSVILNMMAALAVTAVCMGYGLNMYKLSRADFEAPYCEEVIRMGGVFNPLLGTFSGYVDICGHDDF